MPHKNLKTIPYPYKKQEEENYQYYSPETECNHPEYVKVTKVIHSQEFAVAELTEYNMPRIAIRWNINSAQFKDSRCQKGQIPCLGFHYSSGYPTWFILPAGAFINQNGNLEIPLR